MNRHTVTLFIGVIFTGIFLVAPAITFATSGACSGHDGVDCAAGAGAYGQVICNDGWGGSSVSYTSMEECQVSPSPSLTTGSAFAMKQQCASYTTAIQNEIINQDAASEANEKVHPGNEIISTLGEVFYSPVANSCLYTENTVIKNTPSTIDTTTINISGVTFSINDYLDNDTQVYSVYLSPSESLVNSPKIEAFNNTIAYYKGDTSAQAAQDSANTAVQATPTPLPQAGPYEGVRTTPTVNAPAESHQVSAIAKLVAEAQVQATTSAPAASTTPVQSTPQEPAPTHTSFLHKIYFFFANLFGF